MTKKLEKVKLMELNEAYQKTLYWFFSYPNREIGLSDLAESLSISKKTANRIVTKLISEDFLNKKVYGKTWRITCDPKHIYNSSRKVAYNYQLVYEAGIIGAIHNIIQNPRSIILFGSYRKGDDTDESDIDIAVEVLDDEDVKIEPLGILPELGFRKNVQVNLHIFSRNKVDINLFANIVNGIVIDGFLEAKP